ncbi:archease [Candidatus Woesearchaeota archaeon]|nr:archease [Candidatus Woesearchaeota archaeon]
MQAMHKFLDHTADVFFVAKGNTLPELFEQCALAVEETMVEVEKVQPKEKVRILGEEKAVDKLLFDFLDELLFFKDYKQLVFSKFEITIDEKEGKYHLTCLASGEKIDYIRHEPKVDIKAITRHEFKVEPVKDGWKAQVIVDI